MISKVIGNNLNYEPTKWVDQQLAKNARNKFIFISIFVAINVAILLFTFITTIVTINVNANKGDLGIPEWYPYFLVGTNAGAGLLLSLINFFLIRPRFYTASKVARYIRAEKMLFNTKTHDYATAPDPELLLVQNVAKFMNYGMGDLN